MNKEQTDKEKLALLQVAYEQRYKEIQEVKTKNSSLEGQVEALKAFHREINWKERRFALIEKLILAKATEYNLEYESIRERLITSVTHLVDELISRDKGE